MRELKPGGARRFWSSGTRVSSSLRYQPHARRNQDRFLCAGAPAARTCARWVSGVPCMATVFCRRGCIISRRASISNACVSNFATMIPVIGRLYRENNVVTSIHGRSLINKSTMNILKAHRFARRMSNHELLLEETAPLLDALSELELGAAAIDIARLTEKFRAEGDGASPGRIPPRRARRDRRQARRR